MKMKELPETMQAKIRLGIRKKISGSLMVAALLFIPAGTGKWLNGWLLMGLFLLTVIFELLVLLPQNPSLFAQRAEVQPGTKRWDAILTSLVVVVFFLLSLIISGFDYRFHWSPRFADWLTILGSAGWVSGSFLTFWSMLTNTHFESTVRIQTDREHKVIDTGPYKIIRHPGYLGGLITYAVTPLILGSVWCIIPSAMSFIGFVIRTAKEDKTLQAELPGYAEYARHTRYRLIPGIW